MSVTHAVKMLKRGDDQAGLAGAAFWNRVLKDTVRMGRVPTYVSKRNPFFELVEWLPPYGSRRSMEQSFFLRPEGPEQAALALSASFGLVSGRLSRCGECGKPFVRSLRRMSAETCDECIHAKVLTTASGLSRSVSARYRRLRTRLNVWVSRQRKRLHRTLPPQKAAMRIAQVERKRDRRLRRALVDAKRVEAGKLTLDEWRTKHDQKGKPGRPRTG